MPRLAAMTLVVFVAGCSLSQHREPCQTQGIHGTGVGCGCGLCDHPKPVGSIQTGGQFARATTLPIPASGLTLATAVGETLRQGVRNSSIVATPPVVAEKSVVQLTIPEIAAAKTKVSDLVEDLVDGPENDQLAEYLSDIKEPLPRSLADSLQEKLDRAAEGDPSVWSQAAVADREKVAGRAIERRAQQIFDAVYKSQVKGSPRAEGVIVDKISWQIESIVKDFQEGRIADTAINDESLKRIAAAVGNELELGSPVKDSSIVSGTDSLYYQIAVALSRRGGETLIFPLWLVEMFQAGDIALRDGDSIQLLHYNRTRLYRHSRGLQELSDSIATSTPDLDGYIDILRVTTLGDSGLEQYFVPRNTDVAFGPNRGFGFVLENAKVPENATIQPDVLDLVGVIRRGRSEAIDRSADVLQVKTRLQRLEEERKMLRQKISQLPVIGDACQVVESTTGFDSAGAFATARAGVGNAVGLFR